jgi:hypothetical protein
MSKLYPNNVQIVALLEKLAICLSRCTIEISGQEMTRDIDPTTYKHKKRKYLDKLLEMNLIRMTNPNNPTAHTQRYICTELGREIIGK